MKWLERFVAAARLNPALELAAPAVTVTECVFVDDSATNCAAAEAAGIASIVFSGDSAECRTGLIANGYWELRV